MVDDLFVQKIQYFVEGNRTFKGGNQKKKKILAGNITPLGHCTKHLNLCVPFNVTI